MSKVIIKFPYVMKRSHINELAKKFQEQWEKGLVIISSDCEVVVRPDTDVVEVQCNENFGCELPQGHAKYIRHVNDNGHNIADCSMCGHAMQWHDEDEDGVPRFCWFCGAKIDGVED